MSKKLFELTAEIVQAQASAGALSLEDVEAALARTFNMLQQMQRAEEEGNIVKEGGMQAETWEEELREDSLTALREAPMSSIQEDKIVCLECGAEFRQLTANHLKTHGLAPREYKRRWGFPLKQPLAARSLTKARSLSAKERGLPLELQEFQARKREEKKAAAAGEQPGEE